MRLLLGCVQFIWGLVAVIVVIGIASVSRCWLAAPSTTTPIRPAGPNGDRGPRESTAQPIPAEGTTQDARLLHDGDNPSVLAAGERRDDLAATPSRDQVIRALRDVEPRVRACSGGLHGMAATQITVIGATGRVSSASVTGRFAGTPTGSCIVRAVRGAHFPRFSQATFRVSYPFSL